METTKEVSSNQQVERWWTRCKRGNVTKQAALDMYNMIKASGIKDNSCLTWHIVNILVNNNESNQSSITGLPEVAKRKSFKTASKKQLRALNRTIFGKHYSVEVYREMMETLFNLKEISKCPQSREEQDFLDDSITEEEPSKNNESITLEEQFLNAIQTVKKVALDIAQDKSDKKSERQRDFWDLMNSVSILAE
ncbi:MAG: hypothetical protein ACW972_12515 [Promethearchaeota archaeon]|jgi:hypothetical protein